jgi:hypothetical protein
MTASAELAARLKPEVLAAVDRAGLNWLQRRSAAFIAPWIVRVAIEVLLSRLGVALLQLFMSILPFLRQTIRPEYHGDLELVARLLSQPASTFDPAVLSGRIAMVPPSTLFRDDHP